MIEKRTMGYVDFGFPDIEAQAVTVIIDSETGKVDTYRIRDEWCTPSETDHFYDTVEKAAEALDEYKHELIAKMKDIRKDLHALSEWEPDEDVNDPFHFNRRDYLPYSLWAGAYGDEDSWRNLYLEKKKENRYLRDIIRTGFMNVRGESFRREDVERIAWGMRKVELTLKGGRMVTTCNNTEFEVVCFLFGENSSEYCYKHLNEPEDKE